MGYVARDFHESSIFLAKTAKFSWNFVEQWATLSWRYNLTKFQRKFNVWPTWPNCFSDSGQDVKFQWNFVRLWRHLKRVSASKQGRTGLDYYIMGLHLHKRLHTINIVCDSFKPTFARKLAKACSPLFTRGIQKAIGFTQYIYKRITILHFNQTKAE